MTMKSIRFISVGALLVSLFGCGWFESAKEWKEKYDEAMSINRRLQAELDSLRREANALDMKTRGVQYMHNFKIMLLED